MHLAKDVLKRLQWRADKEGRSLKNLMDVFVYDVKVTDFNPNYALRKKHLRLLALNLQKNNTLYGIIF